MQILCTDYCASLSWILFSAADESCACSSRGELRSELCTNKSRDYILGTDALFYDLSYHCFNSLANIDSKETKNLSQYLCERVVDCSHPNEIQGKEAWTILATESSQQYLRVTDGCFNKQSVSWHLNTDLTSPLGRKEEGFSFLVTNLMANWPVTTSIRSSSSHY